VRFTQFNFGRTFIVAFSGAGGSVSFRIFVQFSA